MKFAVWICAWLTFAAGARAAIIDTSTVFDADHPFPGNFVEIVDGVNPPTVVDVVGGVVIPTRDGGPAIVMRGRSELNLKGGILNDYPGTYNIELFDDSRVTNNQHFYMPVRLHDNAEAVVTEGGYLDGVTADGSAHVRIDGGTIDGVRLLDTATARIINPNQWLEVVLTNNQSVAKITSHTGLLHDLKVKDDSTVWLDGSSHNLDMYDRATVHFTGGRVTNNIVVWDDAVLHVYGYNLRLTLGDDEFDTWVQGLDRQHHPFGTTYRLRDNGRIVLHELPEPSTIALGGVALVALVCARRFSANQ